MNGMFGKKTKKKTRAIFSLVCEVSVSAMHPILLFNSITLHQMCTIVQVQSQGNRSLDSPFSLSPFNCGGFFFLCMFPHATKTLNEKIKSERWK